MSTSVFCIANSSEQASSVITKLNAAGFGLDEISVLMPDKSGRRDFAHERNSKAPEGTAAGASAGGLVGGFIGLLAGLGTLAIPGVGALIAAGPLLATLSGAAVGAAIGGAGGAFIGMGIPEYVAKRYEGKIVGGNILLAVHVKDADDAVRAKEIMELCAAEDIHSGSESMAAVKAAGPQA